MEVEVEEVEVEVEVEVVEAAGRRRTYLEALLRVIQGPQLGEDTLAVFGSGRQQARAVLRAAIERRLERLDDVVLLQDSAATESERGRLARRNDFRVPVWLLAGRDVHEGLLVTDISLEQVQVHSLAEWAPCVRVTVEHDSFRIHVTVWDQLDSGLRRAGRHHAVAQGVSGGRSGRLRLQGVPRLELQSRRGARHGEDHVGV